ncbi:hypothetical protein BgiMline_011877 [Biomphalaria glabrata]
MDNIPSVIVEDIPIMEVGNVSNCDVDGPVPSSSSEVVSLKPSLTHEHLVLSASFKNIQHWAPEKIKTSTSNVLMSISEKKAGCLRNTPHASETFLMPQCFTPICCKMPQNHSSCLRNTPQASETLIMPQKHYSCLRNTTHASVFHTN